MNLYIQSYLSVIRRSFIGSNPKSMHCCKPITLNTIRQNNAKTATGVVLFKILGTYQKRGGNKTIGVSIIYGARTRAAAPKVYAYANHGIF